MLVPAPAPSPACRTPQRRNTMRDAQTPPAQGMQLADKGLLLSPGLLPVTLEPSSEAICKSDDLL